MGGFAERDAGRRVQRHLAGALFASALALGLLTACGLSLHSGSSTTELFKSLTVGGDFRVGGKLSLTLRYAQPYPVTVDVACELRIAHVVGTPTPAPTPGTPPLVHIPAPVPTPASKVLDILAATLPINPNGGPANEVTPVLGTSERSFDAPQRPGNYLVKCYTPRDTNNAITKHITITLPAG